MYLKETPPSKIDNDVAELTAQVAIGLTFGSPYDNITNHSALFDQSTEIALVLQGVLYKDIRTTSEVVQE
jgi:hypothetical protein